MQYFISNITLPAAFNKKCEEVQERLRRFDSTLMTSDDALQKVVSEIKGIVADANGKYPKTKEFICHLWECNQYSHVGVGHVSIMDTGNRSVASITYHNVKNIIS